MTWIFSNEIGVTRRLTKILRAALEGYKFQDDLAFRKRQDDRENADADLEEKIEKLEEMLAAALQEKQQRR